MSKRSLLNSTALNPSLNLSPSQSLPESLQPLPEEIQANVQQSEASLSQNDDAHLDGIHVEAPGAVEGDGDPGAVLMPPSDVVPREEWIEGFIGGFNMAGLFIQSLAILPEEMGKARAAADAVYSSALEVESLRFLIAPGGKWIGRGMAVFMFIGPKVKGARAELAQRRLAKSPTQSADVTIAAAATPAAPAPRGERDDERTDF